MNTAMACPVCGSELSETIFTHARLANIRRTYASRDSLKRLMTSLNTDLCMSCGMLYRKPLKTDFELTEYYKSHYVETYKPKTQKLKEKEKSYIDSLLYYKQFYKRHLNFLAENKIDLQGKRILDVGCGTGWFLGAMKECNLSYRLGIEPSLQRCKEIKGRKEFDFQVLNGGVRQFANDKLGTFDLVCLLGVLEHVSNPMAELEACRSFLSKDSFIYIYTHAETPNLFVDMKKRISLVHQLYFTRKSIHILLEKIGLQITNLKIINTDMYIMAKKCESRNPNKRLNRFQYKLLKARYLLNKKIPSSYFDISSRIHNKFLRLKYKLQTGKLTNEII